MKHPGSDSRYLRQIPLFGPEGQERLQQASVLIAGTGGLGSPVAMYLAAAGVGTIRLVDFDAVEESNLNRQIVHWETDLGRKKVISAAEKLHALNPSVEIVTMDTLITERNVEGLVETSQIVVDALDNFHARFALNDAAWKKGVPLVYGAIHGFYGQATTFIPGETGCLRCMVGSVPPAECTPVLGATAGVIGAVQANEVVKYLTGTGDLLVNRLLVWDGLRGEVDVIYIGQDPSCTCGQP